MCKDNDEFKKLLPLKATLEYPDEMAYHSEFRDENITNELEGVMFDEYMRQYQDEYGYPNTKHLNSVKPFDITSENYGSMFPPGHIREEFWKLLTNSGITFHSYTDKVNDSVGNTREAYYTIIFVVDDKVTFHVGNTYKYEEWDEIISDLFSVCGHGDLEGVPSIFGHTGLRKAFVLLTNVDDYRPIFALYDDIAAGFIIDREHKDLTIFDPLSAALIHHELFHLCEQQTTYWYGTHFHSGPNPFYDDSMLETSSNPYVQRFRDLITSYRTDFDLQEALQKYFH